MIEQYFYALHFYYS